MLQALSLLCVCGSLYTRLHLREIFQRDLHSFPLSTSASPSNPRYKRERERRGEEEKVKKENNISCVIHSRFLDPFTEKPPLNSSDSERNISGEQPHPYDRAVNFLNQVKKHNPNHSIIYVTQQLRTLSRIDSPHSSIISNVRSQLRVDCII